MFFDKWRKYSYAAQRQQRHYILKVLAWIFSLFILYSFISTCFITTVVVDNTSMSPSLKEGDRLFVSTVGMGSFLPIAKSHPPKTLERGDIALISLSDSDPERPSAAGRFFASMVRFFTAQRVHISGESSKPLLKRVVAMPGDELSMTEFVFRVQPKTGSYAMTEFELSRHPYDIATTAIPSGWTGAYPLSDSIEKRVLGDDAFFVASDDRSNASDSRTWGPIGSGAIIGKVVFRYWPPSRFGSL